MIQSIDVSYDAMGRSLTVRADPHYDHKLRLVPGARRSQGLSGAWAVAPEFEVFRALEGMGAAFDERAAKIYGEQRRLAEWIDSVKANPDPSPIEPPPLKDGISLYKHQIRAYNIGSVLRHFAALMDMGTGKSLTTVAIAGRRFLKGKIKRLLIVAPTSVVPVWPREFAQYAAFPYRIAALSGSSQKREAELLALCRGGMDALRVAVINYEATWRIMDALTQFAPDMIVLDESQRIKNHSAEQSKAVTALGKKAAYRMILTGTPIQNNPLDFFSQYRFLNPNIYGTVFSTFRNRYAVMGGFGGYSVESYKNLDELTRKAHSIAYRVTKEECLDLPEQTFVTRPVELPGGAMELYRQIKRKSFAELASGGTVTADIVLTRLLRLQQITGGFVTEDGGSRPKPNNTAKLDALRDIIEDCVGSGGKLVVFARFLPEIKAIQGLLDSIEVGHASIYGDVPLKERGGLVERFQNDPECRVFVAQIQTAGLGITLTAADTAVYYSFDFNYANYEQSLARIHRIGQKNACTYIHLVVPGTIDEQILEALGKKEEIARRIVDDWKKFFGGD